MDDAQARVSGIHYPDIAVGSGRGVAIEYLVLSVLFVFALLLSIALRMGNSKDSAKKGQPPGAVSPQKARLCPLCGMSLRKGESVRTITFPGKIDSLSEMHGCPYCHGERAQRERICPVCRDVMSPEDYVIARMFKNGTHLHLLGCTRCRRRR